MTIRPDIGFIAHFPLNAAIKGADVDWALIPVDLTIGRDLADRLTYLRNANGADAFGAAIEIVAPAPLPAVEHDATGGGPTPPVALSPDVAPVAAPVPASGTPAGSFDTPANLAWRARRTALLARYARLTAADLAVFVFPDDRTDLDAIEAELNRVKAGRTKYRDMAVEAAIEVIDAATSRSFVAAVDEGDAIDAAAIAAIGKRYNALAEDVRSWVTVCGAKVRLNPASSGVASVRRRDILAGLIAMAEGKWDGDDLVRAVLAHILGDIVWQGASVADTLAALTIDEARQFAGLATLVAMTHAPFEWPTPDRTVLTSDVTERIPMAAA